jgi:hypothetical protein
LLADKPPAKGDDSPHTHDYLVVKRLTIRDSESGPSITVLAQSSTAGIWASTGRGNECVGLVAQEGVGPYIVLYGEHSAGLPAVALCPDHIQLPDAGDRNKPVVISYADLLKAVRQSQTERDT